MRKKAALTSQKKVGLVMSAMEDKKAIDPIALDVRGRTLIADYFIIANGTSQTHIKAIVDGVIEKLEDEGIKGKRAEGYEEGSWVLLDYGDVIVHIFAQDQREHYNLQSYWTGAEKGSPPPLHPEETS